MTIRGMDVRILAEDIAALVDFYTGILGFRVFWGSRDGDYVAFSMGEADKPVFAVFRKEKMREYTGYEPLPGDGKPDAAVYCISLEDVDGFYRELKAKGAALLGEPQNMPGWGMRCFYFRDPEGNLFEASGELREEK